VSPRVFEIIKELYTSERPGGNVGGDVTSPPPIVGTGVFSEGGPSGASVGVSGSDVGAGPPPPLLSATAVSRHIWSKKASCWSSAVCPGLLPNISI